MESGPIHFLNVQYFFRLIALMLEGRAASLPDLTQLAAVLWLIVTVLGYLLTAAIIWAFIYFTTRLYQIRQAEEHLYTTVSHEVLDDQTDRSRWMHVQELINTGRESDWRQAIIECDIMLDEVLSEQGYLGQTIGDKLKAANPERFRTLQDAWDAHKVRNDIAHMGSSYPLTEQLAHRTVAKYENVFREFGEV